MNCQSKHSTRTLELLGQFNEHLKKLEENWNRGSGSWPPDNVGDNHGIWLTAIDKLLGSRLETHQGELMKHWSPDSEAMSGDLENVVAFEVA